MKCDYDLLIQYRLELQSNFSYILSALQAIKESNSTIISESNWQSLAGDYYKDTINNLDTNINNVNEKLQNILDYLENVVENYKIFENIYGTGFHL